MLGVGTTESEWHAAGPRRRVKYIEDDTVTVGVGWIVACTAADPRKFVIRPGQYTGIVDLNLVSSRGAATWPRRTVDELVSCNPRDCKVYLETLIESLQSSDDCVNVADCRVPCPRWMKMPCAKFGQLQENNGRHVTPVHSRALTPIAIARLFAAWNIYDKIKSEDDLDDYSATLPVLVCCPRLRQLCLRGSVCVQPECFTNSDAADVELIRKTRDLRNSIGHKRLPPDECMPAHLMPFCTLLSHILGAGGVAKQVAQADMCKALAVCYNMSRAYDEYLEKVCQCCGLFPTWSPCGCKLTPTRTPPFLLSCPTE